LYYFILFADRGESKFSDDDLEALERVYAQTPYPRKMVCEKLQQEFQTPVSAKLIQRWFLQRRRHANTAGPTQGYEGIHNLQQR